MSIFCILWQLVEWKRKILQKWINFVVDWGWNIIQFFFKWEKAQVETSNSLKLNLQFYPSFPIKLFNCMKIKYSSKWLNLEVCLITLKLWVPFDTKIVIIRSTLNFHQKLKKKNLFSKNQLMIFHRHKNTCLSAALVTSSCFRLLKGNFVSMLCFESIYKSLIDF